MDDTYLSAPGTAITLEQLSIPRAKQVARVLRTARLPFVSLLECRRLDPPGDGEVVVLEVEVELPQKPVNDIHRHERIAAVFSAHDSSAPEVLALRDSFPVVPHLNLREYELPRSLCIFEEPFTELRLRWSAVSFIEAIRQWLAQTALATLHAADQALEPLLIGPVAPIVVPDVLLTRLDEQSPEPSVILRADAGMGRAVLLASTRAQDQRGQEGPKFLATVVSGLPQPHGIIHRAPANLYDLHQFLTAARIDLLQELRKRVRQWQLDGRLTGLRDAHLVIIVHLPKTRTESSTPESLDSWAFMTTKSILEIGQEIGIWSISSGNPGILIPMDESRKGDTVGIDLLRPVPSFSRELAARLSGLASHYSGKIVLVGVGALGSQVLLNLVRIGFGQWTLVDEDYLLPHNLARHALLGGAIGFAKATILANEANWIIEGDPIANDVVADVLAPGPSDEAIRKSLLDAHLIIDASTSIAVARYLAVNVSSSARRVSIFLNPSGKDLVILIEDTRRATPLDLLEMQYYRHLVSTPDLHDHLRTAELGIRYSRSCRDLSAVIPQELVALHAAIASRALRTAIEKEEAAMAIWQADDLLAVKAALLPTWELIKYEVSDWTIRTDRFFLEKISRLRLERLPNETGGVLVGAFDMQRKIIYVVDTIPSPPDSIEWPTVYIRGYHLLKERLAMIRTHTAQMLEYVGEWHSHTMGLSFSLGTDDRKALTWLADQMNPEGRPGLMLIASDEDKIGWYIKEL